MKYLPIFFSISGKNCLVVGAGGIAARKIELLLKAEAKVHVVANVVGNSLELLCDQNLLRCSHRDFQDNDLENVDLVIAATNNTSLNAHISQLATTKKIPVNVVDNPALCSFIMPSIIDRSPVQIAISTGGTSPVLARLLRAKVEASIPAAYGALANLVEKFRDNVKTAFPNVETRRSFWESILEGQVAEMVFNHQYAGAEKLLLQLLDDSRHNPKQSGEVYLVGCGSGDPDLMTFKAVRLMQKSDFVIYDAKVPLPILELVRRDAEKIRSDEGNPEQGVDDINLLALQLAQQGKRVLQLTRSDRLTFERARTELAGLLEEENIPFQYVPGIDISSD